MAGLFIFGALVLIIVVVVRWQMKKRQKQIIECKLPPNSKELLSATVLFYRRLDDAGKASFEERVRDFLARTAITGTQGLIVTDLDKLLVASAAIIPIFSFPYWRYNNINEVLLYKDAFNHDYQQEGDGRNIIGMVGSGALEGQMILSEPALINSFRYPDDGHNNAIHEFVHLLDKADGAVDGVPEYLLSQTYIIPWVKHIRETIAQMRENGASDINFYGATNEAEFLAVVSEYFFEKPEQLKEHHPELYKFLEEMFHPKSDQ